MKVRLPNNSGGPNNMNAMLKQAQKMQDDMAALQEDLNEREFSAKSGGGMIEVTVNGKHEIKSLKISPEAIDEDDIEMLEDLISAAVGEVISKIEADSNETMGAITGSMPNIPGLF